MPVKWTPENDHLLLVKIIETHDPHIDFQKVATAWPTDRGEVPTARAIKERLVKIRATIKAGASEATDSGTPSKATAAATPAKDTPKSASKASTQRKRAAATDHAASTPSKRKRNDTVPDISVKSEDPEPFIGDFETVNVTNSSNLSAASPVNNVNSSETASGDLLRHGPAISNPFMGASSPTWDDTAELNGYGRGQVKYARHGYGRLGGYDGADDFFSCFDEEVVV